MAFEKVEGFKKKYRLLNFKLGKDAALKIQKSRKVLMN